MIDYFLGRPCEHQDEALANSEENMNTVGLIRFAVFGGLLSLLSSCDSDNEEKLSAKRAVPESYSSRCGLLGPYEFKVSKDYLFFWPTYEGRSDWGGDSKPISGCDGKISTITMEVYFPDMLPAGRLPIENDPNVAHSSIAINSVGELDAWDLGPYLAYLLQQDSTNRESVVERSKDVGLYHHRGRDSTFKDLAADYFWELDGGVVSLLIDCSPIKSGMTTYCEQMQYIPSMQAIVKTRYHSERLASWQEISKKTTEFIESHSSLKGQK